MRAFSKSKSYDRVFEVMERVEERLLSLPDCVTNKDVMESVGQAYDCACLAARAAGDEARYTRYRTGMLKLGVTYYSEHQEEARLKKYDEFEATSA